MDLIQIGVVVNTHGLKGLLRVKSFSDFNDERFKKGNTLYLLFKQEYLPLTVKSFKPVKSLIHVQFEEFTDINQCEKYKGSELYIETKHIHELPEDEYYFTELVGMDVYTDELIGVCLEVREVPQGELLVVKREKQSNLLIPFHKEFIKEVDKENKRITIIEWEGLI